MQPTDGVVHATGGTREVNRALAPFEPRRVDRLRVVLRNFVDRPTRKRVNGPGEHMGAQIGQPRFQVHAGFIGPDGRFGGRQHRTGIERLDDSHDRYAGHVSPASAMNRCRAPQGARQRHVDHAQPGWSTGRDRP
jgi:hypothetical protein